MTFGVVVASGICAYLVVGYLTGNGPRTPRRRRPRARRDRAQLWLVQAGSSLRPAQFWAASAALGVVAFGVVGAMTGAPAVALVPSICTGLAPRWAFARRRARRLREVAASWPDGLRELVAAVSTGRSLPQAIGVVARSGPEPLRRAFARFEVRARVLGVVPALEVVRAELADPTSDRVVEVLILAHQRGGRLVIDVLRDLAEATTADLRTAEAIETDALEQKLNARAVFALPWLVLLALTARPGHFRSFYQSAGGITVVVMAAAASLVGLWIVGRLSSQPLEARILVGAPDGGGG